MARVRRPAGARESIGRNARRGPRRSPDHTADAHSGQATIEEDRGLDVTGRWAGNVHGDNGPMVIAEPRVRPHALTAHHLGDGLDALVTRWAGTDGVTGPPLTLPDGVTSSVLDGYSYAELVAAGRTDLGVLDDLTAAADAVLHVGAEATWDRDVPDGSYLDASAGPASTTVPATGAGRWFLRVPDASAGVQVQADRVLAALTDRTEGIVVVGYGPAGAAALRAAGTSTPVTAVVTVGTPWSDVSLAAIQTGLGGDAARFLSAILPTDLETWPDDLLALECSPLQRGIALATRAATVLDPAALPSAAGESRRPGLEILAVTGAVVDDDVRRAIAAVVSEGVRALLPSDSAPPDPPEELHLGIAGPVLDVELGGVVVGLGGALDLLRLDTPTTWSRVVPPRGGRREVRHDATASGDGAGRAVRGSRPRRGGVADVAGGGRARSRPRRWQRRVVPRGRLGAAGARGRRAGASRHETRRTSRHAVDEVMSSGSPVPADPGPWDQPART